MPFPVVVQWRFGGREDALWTAPFLVDATGKVILYLAAGPAGRPARPEEIGTIDMERAPDGVRVQVVTEADEFGSPVFVQPAHTPN